MKEISNARALFNGTTSVASQWREALLLLTPFARSNGPRYTFFFCMTTSECAVPPPRRLLILRRTIHRARADCRDFQRDPPALILALLCYTSGGHYRTRAILTIAHLIALSVATGLITYEQHIWPLPLLLVPLRLPLVK